MRSPPACPICWPARRATMASPDIARAAAIRLPALPAAAETALVLALLLVGWELLARVVLAGSFVLAAPSEVALHLAERGPLFMRNVLATLETALKGFVIGNAIAIALALAIVQLP